MDAKKCIRSASQGLAVSQESELAQLLATQGEVRDLLNEILKFLKLSDTSDASVQKLSAAIEHSVSKFARPSSAAGASGCVPVKTNSVNKNAATQKTKRNIVKMNDNKENGKQLRAVAKNGEQPKSADHLGHTAPAAERKDWTDEDRAMLRDFRRIIRQRRSPEYQGKVKFEYKCMDIAEAEEDVVAHLVGANLKNTKGAAKALIDKFGAINAPGSNIRIGSIVMQSIEGDRAIWHVASKERTGDKKHKNPGRFYRNEVAALTALHDKMREQKLQKIAITKLGAGLDGIPWKFTKQKLREIFADDDVTLVVHYLPRREELQRAPSSPTNRTWRTAGSWTHKSKSFVVGKATKKQRTLPVSDMLESGSSSNATLGGDEETLLDRLNVTLSSMRSEIQQTRQSIEEPATERCSSPGISTFVPEDNKQINSQTCSFVSAALPCHLISSDQHVARPAAFPGQGSAPSESAKVTAGTGGQARCTPETCKKAGVPSRAPSPTSSPANKVWSPISYLVGLCHRREGLDGGTLMTVN
ncbi:uncharacterized protein LOC132194803 [Neocloeon triangulifer]|uniref:uncharacterized protein LOC132194803 n=2 Tax=Neocloeon triangulifer TaxID=2078957 RepID=UPI00286ED88A|nr:uncharacterized protein LOC132194803 [Neocloeon triangulifer]